MHINHFISVSREYFQNYFQHAVKGQQPLKPLEWGCEIIRSVSREYFQNFLSAV